MAESEARGFWIASSSNKRKREREREEGKTERGTKLEGSDAAVLNFGEIPSRMARRCDS